MVAVGGGWSQMRRRIGPAAKKWPQSIPKGGIGRPSFAQRGGSTAHIGRRSPLRVLRSIGAQGGGGSQGAWKRMGPWIQKRNLMQPTMGGSQWRKICTGAQRNSAGQGSGSAKFTHRNTSGDDTSILELKDSIRAARMTKLSSSDEYETGVSCITETHIGKKRARPKEETPYKGGNEKIMFGFGLPDKRRMISHRNLPKSVEGPPYFYYENVARAPKGVWDTFSRILYEIEPEFVDSKYVCAAARKRGYIHNLPIEGRSPLRPTPPRTITDALPMTRKWWPSWDKRTQLNCLQTCIASAKLTERIRSALSDCSDPPPTSVRQFVLRACKQWNLVWVGLHKVAPLEPDKIETLLGFPRDHTRGISRTDRYRSLGNSFQVDTVAFHLSVLKRLFPEGIRVLSLFSGIGGAEVALHRLEIPLKVVVSVEISEINRNILQCWWKQTDQKGTLIDIADVQELTSDKLDQLHNNFGPFDLVIGGSPCNNLAGSNRYTRDGLDGKHSSLFFEYSRILKEIRGKK